MNATLTEKYRSLRRKHPGLSASQAYRWATAKPPRFTLDWRGEEARLAVQGFEVVVRKEVDEDGDTSWLGHFTDTWEPGAIDLTHRHTSYRPHEYKYYVSCNHPNVEKEARDLNQKCGLGKGEAYETARRYRFEDLQRLEDYANGEWCFYGVVVTVYREGIELGSDALWGIESDSEEYFDEAAGDLIPRAVQEAKATLKKLCPARRGRKEGKRC
jgi:hypothetical protein